MVASRKHKSSRKPSRKPPRHDDSGDRKSVAEAPAAPVASAEPDEAALANAANFARIRDAALRDHEARLQRQLSALETRAATAEAEAAAKQAALTRAVLDAAKMENKGTQKLARSPTEMQAEIDRLRAVLATARTIDHVDNTTPKLALLGAVEPTPDANHEQRLKEMQARHAGDLERMASGLGDRMAQEIDAKLREAQAEWENDRDAALAERDRHWKIEIDKRLEKARRSWSVADKPNPKPFLSGRPDIAVRAFMHAASARLKATKHGAMGLGLVAAIAAVTVIHYATVEPLPEDKSQQQPALRKAEATTPQATGRPSDDAIPEPAAAAVADRMPTVNAEPAPAPPTAAERSTPPNETGATEAELIEAQRAAEQAKAEADQAKRQAQAALREAQSSLQTTEATAAEQRAALEAQIEDLRSRLEAAETRADEAAKATGATKSKLSRAVARAKQAERESEATRARSENEVRYRVRELLDKLRQQIAVPPADAPAAEEDLTAAE